MKIEHNDIWNIYNAEDEIVGQIPQFDDNDFRCHDVCIIPTAQDGEMMIFRPNVGQNLPWTFPLLRILEKKGEIQKTESKIMEFLYTATGLSASTLHLNYTMAEPAKINELVIAVIDDLDTQVKNPFLSSILEYQFVSVAKFINLWNNNQFAHRTFPFSNTMMFHLAEGIRDNDRFSMPKLIE